jgi:ERCC4-related helicase
MSDDVAAGRTAEHVEESAHLREGLLVFQQQLVEELLQNDGLTVMAKGLGVCTVAASLLALHYLAKDSGGVVLILGVSNSAHVQQ